MLAGLWQVRAGGSVLGYVCIGLGCGLFGQGTGKLVARWSMRNDPALQKEQEILRRDERNVAIADHAKGRAFDLMTFVFGALMVSFALMEVDLDTPSIAAANTKKRCERADPKAPLPSARAEGRGVLLCRRGRMLQKKEAFLCTTPIDGL